MTLALGLVAYGSARLLTSTRHGFPILVLGLLCAWAIRPHIAAMAMLALVVAYLTRRAPKGQHLLSPLRKLVGLVVLGAGLVFLAGQASNLLGVDSYNAEAVQTARSGVVLRTEDAGSSYTDDSTDLNPAEFPVAVISVLFRPFPWEARNAQSLIAASEGLVLLILFVVGRRRLVGAVRSILHTPYVVLCVVYSTLFIYGFSSFANFGILTRQRVQVLPFVVVLLCLPKWEGSRKDLPRLLTAAPA